MRPARGRRDRRRRERTRPYPGAGEARRGRPVHPRRRRRLAELLRAQVADTLDEAAEVDAELLHLLHVLANHTPDL